MKKVVCAQCGLVNLDKFVSFPHCAACGSLLPAEKPPKWRVLWRRPVRPLYWMLAVGSGLGLLGLAIASIARETRAVGDKPLLIYAETPRDIAAGQIVTAQFTLDSALENPDENFRNVSLRLRRETWRDFEVVSVRPAPIATEVRGRGHYYLWDKLARNTTIELALKPRVDAGKNGDALQLHATLWASQYQQFEVRTSVARVAAPASPPMQRAPEVAR